MSDDLHPMYERRQAQLRVHYQSLHEVLGLPDDVRILGVADVVENGAVDLLLECQRWPHRSAYSEVPFISCSTEKESLVEFGAPEGTRPFVRTTRTLSDPPADPWAPSAPDQCEHQKPPCCSGPITLDPAGMDQRIRPISDQVYP